MDVADLITAECICCLGTYTGKPRELPGLGWRHKAYKCKGTRAQRDILLCGDCLKRLEPIWAAATKAAKKAA